jgi:hypothetical protein
MHAHAHAHIRPANAVSAERLPSSNSTSPQPANIIIPGASASARNLDITVFPSPTPSEEDVRDRGSEAGHSVEVSLDRFEIPQSPYILSSTRPNFSEESGQQHVPPPKRPATGDPPPADKRPRLDNAVPLGGISPNAFGMVSPAEQSAPELARMPRHLSHPQNPPIRSPPLVQGGLARRPPALQTQPQVSVEERYRPIAPLEERVATLTEQPPSSPTDDWLSPELFMQCLRSFRARFYVPGAVKCAGNLRLDVLEYALQVQDWEYLALHQCYCLNSFSPQHISLEMRHPNTHSAYLFMEEVIGDNGLLKGPFPQFFCDFPFPRDFTAKNPPRRYLLALGNFRVFVRRSSDMVALTRGCERRKVPPSPLEMTKCGILSSVFQRVLFRRTVSKIWEVFRHCPEKEVLREQAVQLFQEAQLLVDSQIRVPQCEPAVYQVFANHFNRLTDNLELALRQQGYFLLNSALPPAQQQQQNQHQNQQSLPHPQNISASQAGPMMSMQPGMGPGAHALSHLQQAQIFQQQQQQYHHRHVQQQQQQQRQSHQTQQRQPQLQHQQQPPQRQQQLQHQQREQQQQQQLVSPQAMSRPAASPALPSPRHRQGSTALLPRLGLRQQQQREPVPPRLSLHQAHLRSPTLQASRLSPAVNYFWQGFVAEPQRVTNANNKIQKLSFRLHKKELAALAGLLPTPPGAPERRAISEESKMIRLRCVKWPQSERPPDHDWAVAPNSWIPHSYFKFNGVSLELRKKLHNGRDKPVELTGLARAGLNALEVVVMSSTNDTKHHDYLLAIEYLGALSNAKIKQRCQEQAVSAAQTISDIKRKLSSSIIDDDDDMVVVESTLTINLRDPYSASKMCDTPVRGRACLHNECFDLDTFLETRKRKGEDVTSADQWHCPICKADARPHTLLIDEFLVKVREELARRGLLDTRAIEVDKEGRWRPKVEERDPHGVQDPDTPEPAPVTARSSAARSSAPRQVHLPPAHEIIDLDSD